MSLPTRGGWIEIMILLSVAGYVSVSLPTRGGWIEIPSRSLKFMTIWSLPTRGGWIEMVCRISYLNPHSLVPPHTGKVD